MSSTANSNELPVVIFVHIHYPEIWQEMCELLSGRLTVPFRLFLTSSLPATEIMIPDCPSLVSTRFLQVENRGRDILPFLRCLTEAQDFEFGLKLHTKKSPQRDDGAQWRTELLNSLIPSSAGVMRIIQYMRSDRRIGLVTPAGFCLSVRPWVLQNAAGLNRIMLALGADVGEYNMESVFFAAGSMFWFRRSSLTALAAAPDLPALFEPEEGQLDGTIAHAMERMFPVEARRQGYVSLAVSALTSSHVDLSWTELLELARRHADTPSPYFPAPYVSPSPQALGASERTARSGVAVWLASLYRSVLPQRVRVILRRLIGRPLPQDYQ